jgi:hypothetical protein
MLNNFTTANPMNREPINPDDPQMSAYALGEMSAAEAAEFTAKLQDSPIARAELSSMQDVMSLLSEGLRNEWESSMERPALMLLDPVEAVPDPVLIPVDFRSKWLPAAAAAAVAVLGIAGGAFFNREGDSQVVALLDSASAGMVVADVSAGSSGASGATHIPQLFLADEIEDLSSLDLVGESEMGDSQIDASYLESDQIIPASYTPGLSGVRQLTPERIDSYLPAMPIRGITTGMIERRLNGREQGVSSPDGEGKILVRGYVRMGGDTHQTSERFLAGFNPVSISGNPVEEENDLKLLSELSNLQRDLSEMASEMPTGVRERARLEELASKSSRLLSQLKSALAR